MRRSLFLFVPLVAALFMVACTESPKTTPAQPSATEPSGPSGPVTGKTAFWAMYKSAYSWANDVVPLKLESESIPGIKNEGGNAAMWTATFASPRKQEALKITYAVAAKPPDIVKGLNVGLDIPWAGPTLDVMPFQGSDIVVDSDGAYKTAAAKAEAWLKTHPDKEVSFLMGNNSKTFATPVWYVLWGDQKDGYGVFVNTKTGEIAKRAK
jgi:hypothetical protein